MVRGTHAWIFSSLLLLACGGAATEANDPLKPGEGTPEANAGNDAPPATNVGTECANPTRIVVSDNWPILRPAEQTIRLNLVYQGAECGAESVEGVDTLPPASRVDATEGVNSGYWVDLRSSTGEILFQRGISDPTTQEVTGPMVQQPIDKCVPKRFQVDVPNDPKAASVVLLGSPYGTNGPAKPIARFELR